MNKLINTTKLNTKIANRLAELRTEMRREGIDCYIIPTDDFHSSEYVGDYFKFREYMSGFTGSAGTLVITGNEALLWTDGRYFLQAESEVDGTGISLMKSGMPDVQSMEDWLKSVSFDGMTVAYDGRTVNMDMGCRIREAVLSQGAKVVNDAVMSDIIWHDRPEIPDNPCFLLDISVTGKKSEEKILELRNALETIGADEMLLTAPEDIAWLFNLRGIDIDYTPVFLSYSIVSKEHAVLYVGEHCINTLTGSYLEKLGVEIRPYFSIYDDIKEYEKTGSKSSVRLLMDRKRVNEALALKVNNPVFGRNPVEDAKALKNSIEIANMRQAHVLDGAALTKTIFHIKKLAASGKIHDETELSIEKYLTGLRKQSMQFADLSFASIVATGKHGAIIHYEPTPETDCSIEDGFLLMDTGAHYCMGTTDVTRTVSVNPDTLTQKMREHYTAVLKGHLDLMMTKFKYGAKGSEFDAIARKPVNDIGQDYMHGTGHGVGYMLSVHEGPCAFRKKSEEREDSIIKENMIISDEPGIYIEGRYGIRIENLVLCSKVNENQVSGLYNGAQVSADLAHGCETEETLLGFESLTLAPYDKDAILFEMLTEEEKEFLAEYNLILLEKLAPYLSEEEFAWLKEETDTVV